MVKRIILIFISLIVISCAGLTGDIAKEKSNAPKENFWVTHPKSGAITIIGVSGPQLKPEDEIAAALLDAAQKVSMFHGVYVKYESIENIGTRMLDYYVDSEINMVYDEQYDKYLEKLTYVKDRDILKQNNQTFVKFTYSAPFPENISYSNKRNPDGAPEWTRRPPAEINGMAAGVGFARRHLRMRDTFIKSYQAAAVSIVSQTSTKITTSTSQNTSEFDNTQFIYRKSSGRLAQFIVIDTWVDPEKLDVWTLAVARVLERNR